MDVAAWGDRPTYRVRGKNFVFASNDGASFSVKLDAEEAWVTVTLGPRVGADRWREVEEWICTSYSLVAPPTLTRAAGLVG